VICVKCAASFGIRATRWLGEEEEEEALPNFRESYWTYRGKLRSLMKGLIIKEHEIIMY
jgi:hypothetical protein